MTIFTNNKMQAWRKEATIERKRCYSENRKSYNYLDSDGTAPNNI